MECLLTKHLKEVIATAVMPPPIIAVQSRWDEGIYIRNVASQAAFTAVSPFISNIQWNVTCDIINIKGDRQINYNMANLRNACWQSIFDNIDQLIRVYNKTQNTKLTKLYRWYDRYAINLMRVDQEYANVMYNLFLYINAQGTELSAAADGILAALNMLMSKYDSLAVHKFGSW